MNVVNVTFMFLWYVKLGSDLLLIILFGFIILFLMDIVCGTQWFHRIPDQLLITKFNLPLFTTFIYFSQQHVVLTLHIPHNTIIIGWILNCVVSIGEFCWSTDFTSEKLHLHFIYCSYTTSSCICYSFKKHTQRDYLWQDLYHICTRAPI